VFVAGTTYPTNAGPPIKQHGQKCVDIYTKNLHTTAAVVTRPTAVEASGLK